LLVGAAQSRSQALYIWKTNISLANLANQVFLQIENNFGQSLDGLKNRNASLTVNGRGIGCQVLVWDHRNWPRERPHFTQGGVQGFEDFDRAAFLVDQELTPQ
jgi:hypothetical protein